MKKSFYLLLILILLPINIYAYSNELILGGETIGIEVKSNGIYIVGFYKVNNKNIALESGFLKGDIIKEINNKKVTSINSLNSILTEENTYDFKVERNNHINNIKLKIEKENNILKTGLYVKDQINGIGTLSYIDPNTKIFGALGHEILESTTLEKFKIKEGKIYKAEVSSIKKSSDGITGEKNANIDKEIIEGDIHENEIEGIFGKYTDNIDNKETILVATNNEITTGDAYIKTVIKDSTIEEFKINIISIDEQDPTKNIYFEITDNKLINKTGGIVQGMSGSPIIQNNKIIGVVNYVVVEDTNKGYGIFITSMLKEGDELITN